MTSSSPRPLLALLALAASVLTAWAADAPPKLRLAEVQKVSPLSYQAELTLDPEKEDFTGTIAIKLNVEETTQTIWLNQEAITVQKAALTQGGKTLPAKVLAGGDDFVGFHFDQAVAAGASELSIRYSGKVTQQKSSGLFRRQDSDNWYIFSQFESTDARAAFPCFDEPSYKTPWRLTLHIPGQDSAISNTGIEGEKTEGTSKIVTFRQTKPLPSYLVALAVGPFEYVNAGTAGKNKVPVRIVVPKGRSNQAKYAAEITAAIITHHEEYFGVDYPYDKADQVAIANLLDFGAMENPGMVTYGESILLADPERDIIGRQRGYASVAAHELAHQWFGDLVTTAWWNDIWLNESFATWLEQKYIAEWKPEWNTRVDDVGAKLGAQDDDSLVSARKIRQPIETKGDIGNAFDGITYQKGAAVIGMFERWMGSEDFRNGVRSYMKQYAFKTATAPDFLDSLSSSSKSNVTAAFSTFLNQPGVPLVSVSLDCANGQPVLHLEQERYLPLGSKGSTDMVWQIPVCVRYGTGDSGKSECKLIAQKSTDWTLETHQCPTWVQANDKALGYYRVQYKGSLLPELIQGDLDSRLSAAERMDLLGNVRAMATGGKLPMRDELSLIEKFSADRARRVRESAIGATNDIRAHLVPVDQEPNYRLFVLRCFQAQARALGWTPKPDDTDDTRLLRPVLLSVVATTGGDQELAEEAKHLTNKWLKDHNAVDPNIVSSVLGTAAYYGDQSLFTLFLAEYKKTNDPQVKQALLNAMFSFREAGAVKAIEQAVLAAGDISLVEGQYLLLYSGQVEQATRKMPLDFVKIHYDEITAAMPVGEFSLSELLPQVGQSYCDAESRSELEAFFRPRLDKLPGAQRTLDQVTEGIDLCIAQTAAQQPEVVAFLRNYQPDSGSK
ncbi:MAG: M1 family metallopeptidase [Bryobacteraceae bacterium]